MTHTYYRRLLICCGLLAVCVITGYFVPSLHGSEKRYEIHPEITLPQYKTDFDRVLDAYELLMRNYMGLTERNFEGIHTNAAEITRKIDLLDQKLTAISCQMEAIQKKLGIEVPPPPAISKIQSDPTEPEKESD